MFSYIELIVTFIHALFLISILILGTSRKNGQMKVKCYNYHYNSVTKCYTIVTQNPRLFMFYVIIITSTCGFRYA